MYQAEHILADRSGSAHAGATAPSDPTRPLVPSREEGSGPDRDFMDAILCGLLTAQAAWIATRDPAALRRTLIEMLAVVGQAAAEAPPPGSAPRL